MTIQVFINIVVPNDTKRYFIPYEDLDRMEDAFCEKYGFDAVPEGTIFETDIDIDKIYADAQAKLWERIRQEDEDRSNYEE